MTILNDLREAFISRGNWGNEQVSENEESEFGKVNGAFK